MDKIEKKIIQKYLSARKSYATKITPKERIVDLLKKIRPFQTQFDLVRMGPDEDGGYLLPDDFDGIEACFSPGVGSESRFEKECVEKGWQVFLADASVDGPADGLEGVDFVKKYIGVVEDSEHMTLEGWVGEKSEQTSGDLVLQMDIEGDEYGVFLGCSPEVLNRFRVILVEFHRIDDWWSLPYFNLVEKVFENLLKSHICVHNHPNTSGGCLAFNGLELPRGIEMTFIRRDRVLQAEPVTSLPHSLDCYNTEREGFKLPDCWYKF